MQFITLEEGTLVFPVEVPLGSILWKEKKKEDVIAVRDILSFVIPKLSTGFPYDSFFLLYKLGHPPKRNSNLGGILSRMVDLRYTPLIKGGYRGTSLLYFLDPTA